MKTKFKYTGIRVKDLDASIAFYTNVLGMKVLGRDRFEATKGTVADLVSEEGGFVLELNHYEKGSPYATNYAVGEGLDHLAFKVEDLDKALAEAKKAGHPVVLDIKTGTSRWAYIEDPNGIWIELSA
jgi:lactoylglutathione lyase